MRIERLRLKNYKMFRNVDLRDIPALAVFVGVNGSGKTTLVDVFDFLRDALRAGVEVALNTNSTVNFGLRGGFREMRTRGEDGPIEVEMAFLAELDGAQRRLEYLLRIGENDDGKPQVEREILTCPLGDGPSIRVLDFANGKGSVVDNEAEYGARDDDLKKREESQDPRLLAVASICQADRYKAAGVLRKFVDDWHLSNFQNMAARGTVNVGEHKHLGELGQNLAGFVHFMQSEHPKVFRSVMEKMSRRVPGFSGVRAEVEANKEIRLMFNDIRWREPFSANKMSDGTLKMLGILSLLHDPDPRSLLCVEEPENQLYPYLLGELMEDFRLYAQRGSGQVLVTTHSYELLDAAKLEEVFWLVKRDGFSVLHRAKDDETIAAMTREEGFKLGELWRDGYLEGARP